MIVVIVNAIKLKSGNWSNFGLFPFSSPLNIVFSPYSLSLKFKNIKQSGCLMFTASKQSPISLSRYKVSRFSKMYFSFQTIACDAKVRRNFN